MIVQIYEVGTPEEAAHLVALGVDHVGVLVGDGEFPREIGAAAARGIFDAVGPDARRVALSLAHDPDRIARLVEAVRPDVVHLGTPPDRLSAASCRLLKRRFPELPLMRTLPVLDRSSVDAARAWEGVADFLLLDTWRAGDPEIGATGETHDWGLSREIVERVRVPVVLAGGLGPENVARAIREVRPAGVDSKTRTDRADGTGKDLDRVRAFVERARSA